MPNHSRKRRQLDLRQVFVVSGLRNSAEIATKILDAAEGDCEVCASPIGDTYCALAQLHPIPGVVSMTVEASYRVCCSGCYGAVNEAINARRSLR